MRTPTLRDVAARAGVHPGTASRALNPTTRTLVNDATVGRVRRAAEELGYRPNPIARSLKTSRSGSIGVVVPDLTNPLFPPIVRGVEDVLIAAGYSALIANTDNDADREARHVASLRSRQVEGLIVATARRHHPLLDQLAAEGMPMVLVNRRVEGADITSVTADDAAGVALGVHHLVELGHRRIVHLAGPQWTSTGVVRLRAFRQALADAKLPESESLVEICDVWSEESGEAALGRLLDAARSFTAVLAGNDLLALGAYGALEARGLACPGDVSVLGFNDMPFSDRLGPPLTSVRIPHYQIGAEAARLLLERFSDPSAPTKSVLLPVSLVARRSTAPRRGAGGTRAGRSRSAAR
ncbi:MAG: LacI family DNA-binding transcriptional regulator [Streptomycetales bacterium]